MTKFSLLLQKFKRNGEDFFVWQNFNRIAGGM